MTPAASTPPPSPDHRCTPLGWSWFDRVLTFLVTATAYAVAIARAASTSQWRDDLPAVRDFGLVSVGLGGGVSTVLTQAFSLLPIGPRHFRAAAVSALALALAARLLYGLVRSALAAARPPSALASTLTAIAVLTATMAPTWQREATVGGGAMIAVALVLAAISVLQRADADASPARRALALGALTGAALAESVPAALAIAAAVGARLACGPTPFRHLPRHRALALAGSAFVATALVLLAPAALRPFASHGVATLGSIVSAASVAAPDLGTPTATALAAWLQEIGVVSLVIALGGAALAVARAQPHAACACADVRKRLLGPRAAIAPFVALVALDTLVPARLAGLLSADAWSAVRALAVASITAASALGVHEVVALLARARIPMARSAAVLVVVFHMTLVALTAEEAGFAADRGERTMAEAWTDEALERLPPSSALLVRSPALAWRLWAARVVRGERPDVAVVPIPLLDRGTVAASLLGKKRELEPLLRSYALTGAPSEFALSKLADERPLHVELDRGWPRRLAQHLTASGLWLEYLPQPIGPSDRRPGSAAALASARRMHQGLAAEPGADPSTAAVLADALRAQASVLWTLGDAPSADQFLERIGELAAHEPSLATRRLPYALKGVRRVAVRRKDPPPKRR